MKYPSHLWVTLPTSVCGIALFLLATTPLHSSPALIPEKLISCTVQPRFVIDGDTLWAICNGHPLKIRLACIDAPEIEQAYGIASRDDLR